MSRLTGRVHSASPTSSAKPSGVPTDGYDPLVGSTAIGVVVQELVEQLPGEPPIAVSHGWWTAGPS